MRKHAQAQGRKEKKGVFKSVLKKKEFFSKFLHQAPRPKGQGKNPHQNKNKNPIIIEARLEEIMFNLMSERGKLKNYLGHSFK